MQFNANGKFKILLLADVQDSYPLEKDIIAFINETLDKTKPDLVVFLGDIIMTPKINNTQEEYLKAYDELLEPLVTRKIPFSLVFGNHDQEKMPSMTLEEKLAKYMSYEGCLAYDADPSLHGTGTHNLEIKSSDGTKTAFNLWFMDSGDYAYDKKGNKFYDCVRKDQIKWYEEKSKQLEAENGQKVMSVMFQHIVTAEIAKRVMVTLPFHIGKLARSNMTDGSAITYLPNIFGIKSGYAFECLGNSRDNDGQWDAISKRGDVLVCFFGHDHNNTYKATVNGVDGIAIHSCTYRAYHDDRYQGAALLTIDEKDTSKYQLDYIYSNDLALEKGSILPTLSRDRLNYEKSRAKRIRTDKLLNLAHKVTGVFKKNS